MNKLEGKLEGAGKSFGIVVARFNDFVTSKLLEGALKGLQQYEVAEDSISVAWVPGAFELPFVAKQMAASKKYHAVICLGALIRGETAHFDYIAQAASIGMEQASRETGVPVIFGLLTCDNMEQAMDRVGGKTGHKGEEAAFAALEMAHLNALINEANVSV